MLKVLLLVLILTYNRTNAEISATEGRIIGACLERYGGMTHENAERLQRYKEWSDDYEEFPCFTNCYLDQLGAIYTANDGFDENAVSQQFGPTLLSACQSRLHSGNDNCARAYNGFHCLVTLQDDPFVLIESMTNVSAQARVAMKDCLRKFNEEMWARLKDYPSFPVREPIPCYTKCFVDALGLLNVRNRQWNLSHMHTQLGVPKVYAQTEHCRSMVKRRRRNACAWVYREFTCLAKASQ